MKISLQEAYVTLGVAREASSDQVRQAYRQLALRYHPDKNPGDPTATEKFQKLSAAYKRICDGPKQRSHDFGDGFFNQQSDEEFEFDDEELDLSVDDMLEMFEMMFGCMGGSGPPRSRRTKKKTGFGVATKAKRKPQDSDDAVKKKVPGVRVDIGGSKARRRRPIARGRGGMPRMDDLEADFMYMASFLESTMAEMDASFPLSDSDDTDDEILRSQFFGKSYGSTRRSNQEPIEKTAVPSKDEKKKTPPANVQVGDRVQVYNKHTGVVQFLGPVHYASGEFVGVELSEAVGKNDGTIKGVSYFSCAPSYGIMVRPDDVAIMK